MPTAVEYALLTSLHTQNGAGGGPLAQQDAAVGWLPPTTPSGELLLTGPLAGLLLVAVVAAAVRRRMGFAAPKGRTLIRHC